MRVDYFPLQKIYLKSKKVSKLIDFVKPCKGSFVLIVRVLKQI